jgi:hypothetical protein
MAIKLIVILALLIARVLASPVNVHLFINLDTDQVSEHGYDLFSQIYVDQIDEIFLENDDDLIIIKEKIEFFQKIDKSQATLLIYPGHVENANELIKEISKISQYFGLRIFLGKDYKLQEKPITIGELHYELDNEPRGCETEFTGRTSGIVNAGFGFKFKTDISFENPFLYETVKPLEIKGSVPTHFIYIGKNSRKSTYGCKRSYPVNKQNIAKYFRYIDTRARYNLHALNCDNINVKKSTYFMSSFKSGNSVLYFSMNTKDCNKFLEKLEMAKKTVVDFEITETAYFKNWNLVTEHVYEAEEYEIVRILFSLNFDYQLSKSHSFLNRREILWITNSDPLP